MTKNLTELAQAATDALKAYNAAYKREKQSWDASRYGKHFAYNNAYISDEQHIELLTEIVEYDDDASSTLQELIWQTEWECPDNEADYRYEEMRSNELLQS